MPGNQDLLVGPFVANFGKWVALLLHDRRFNRRRRLWFLDDFGGGAGELERLESRVADIYGCDLVSALYSNSPNAHTHQERESPSQQRASMLLLWYALNVDPASDDPASGEASW